MRSIWCAIVAALLGAGVLAACGSSAQPTAPSSATQHAGADYNKSDIAFARSMIPHHEQAVEMAQMVPTQTKSQQMVDLANKVIATQVPEIKAFRAWLMARQDAPGHDPSDSGGMAMMGMVNQATLEQLRSLTGPEFDRLWLTSMIEHHRGAIAMAKEEVARGKNPDMTYLAKSIISGQQAEIDQFKQMLGG